MGINKAFILGRLGQDPELRYTNNQNAICTLNVATNERKKSANGEWTDHTEWHSVVVWGKQAENCNQYLSKGREVFIEGRLQTRKWEDQSSGQTRYRTEIIASNVQFVGGKGNTFPTPESPKETSGNIAATTISIEEDDIPF